MKKKTSINLDENCYLFSIKHGKRNDYIENITKERIKELSNLLVFLKKKFTDKEIMELIEEMNLPTGEYQKKNTKISTVHRETLMSFWEETKKTGLTPEELISIIYNSGYCFE